MFKLLSVSFLLGFQIIVAAPVELDAFQQTVKPLTDKQKGSGYDVQFWLTHFYKGNFKEAAHLWSSIQFQIPSQMRDTAEAIQLYSLWKLDLPQTFVDAWFLSLPRQSFRKSTGSLALEEIIAPQMVTFLETHGIFFTKEQESTLRSLPSTPLYNEMRAWPLLRQGLEAKNAIAQLPVGHPWRILLTKTVSLALVRQGKVQEAITLLEKEIKALPENAPNALATYQLQLARLLYQEGDLEGAEKYYAAIPEKTTEYLNAREELLWVWLRTGDMPKLRGDLASLSLPLYQDRFAPELYVVRAISNLKLCQYDNAHRDFDAFIKKNSDWANQIQTALAAEEPAPPPHSDWYGKLVERALTSTSSELTKVRALQNQSLAAGLPAVGKQVHWTTAAKDLQNTQSRLKKLRSNEYRRQWKNASIMVREAIRKMQFVKIELMTQLRQGLKGEPNSEATVAAKEKVNDAVRAEMDDTPQNFPFDGVVWPDELFKLRSTASSQCY